MLSRKGMTQAEIDLADKHNLFKGTRGKKAFVFEHQLVALKKYGNRLSGTVIRHLNGVKTDNRPENLVRGTTQENTMDHNKARLMAMYWRERYEELISQRALTVTPTSPLTLIPTPTYQQALAYLERD